MTLFKKFHAVVKEHFFSFNVKKRKRTVGCTKWQKFYSNHNSMIYYFLNHLQLKIKKYFSLFVNLQFILLFSY